jgi:hypothetical protein
VIQRSALFTKGTEKGAKVTVYYTESAGKKVAHFFEKL